MSFEPNASKVAKVTAVFWIMKIAATTLGETAGDWVTMSLRLGYLAGTAIFAVVFAAAVSAQIAARTFHPLLYWTAMVATTTLGTTLADLCDRKLGIGYAGGSAVLFALVLLSLLVWRRSMGSVAVSTVTSPKAEAFYWTTILFSQTLGTALGDWAAAGPDESPPGLGLGYVGGAALFGGALAVVAALYFFTPVSRVVLFWAAFVLTRPLGATLGDFLDKPIAQGGLNLSRGWASAVLVVFLLACVLFIPRRILGGEDEPDDTEGRAQPA